MPTLLPFVNRQPQTAAVIRERCKTLADKYANKPELPANWKATTIGVLQGVCYYGEEMRHSVLMYLFGVTSSTQLTKGAWWSLYSWVFPHPMGDDCGGWCKQTDDKWHHHDALPQEIKNILYAQARVDEEWLSAQYDAAICNTNPPRASRAARKK